MADKKYWIDESHESMNVAKILLEKKKYLESAFFCNLSCEKILKAAIIHHTSETPPKIHALVQLAQKATIYDKMTEKQRRFLNKLDVFQIEGRYPVYRSKIYKTTPPQEFDKIYSETNEVIKWVEQQLT